MLENISKTPFNLSSHDLYKFWRDYKLETAPKCLSDIVVEIGDPRQLTVAEHAKMLSVLQTTNMVIYAGNSADNPDKSIPRSIGDQFGLSHLNHNWLADGDGITSLKVNQGGTRPSYIPYTNRPIKWHTDGYYNPRSRQCHAIMLHCVNAAGAGGSNRLMDHELAYIHLRDQNPQFIESFMTDNMMTIPPGTDMEGNPRDAAVGPVFSIRADGELHMRYTERSRNVEWLDDERSISARAALSGLLKGDTPGIIEGTLQSGMGLICNNVLHDRSGFDDSEQSSQRLLYRSRFFDRIAGTGWRHILKM
jgi:hypothetical protein